MPAGGKVRGVLGALEQALAVGIVVALLRLGKAGLDAEIDEPLGQRLAAHRGTTIGMQRELIFWNRLTLGRLLD